MTGFFLERFGVEWLNTPYFLVGFCGLLRGEYVIFLRVFCLMSTSAILLLCAVPIIVWRLYARLKRLVGKQRSSLTRHWLVALFFPLIVAMLTFANRDAPLSLGGLALGLTLGATLAFWAFKLTKFERDELQWYYTPNAKIGIAIIVIILARLGYRLFQMVTLTGDAAQAAGAQFVRSPVTTIAFGLLAGFYCCYSVGLIQWRLSSRIAVVNDK